MRNPPRGRHLLFSFITVLAFLNSFYSISEAKVPAYDLLEAEQLLAALGYPVSKADGIADASTYHSIVAFQKVEGLKRTGKVSNGLIEALRFATRPVAQFSTGRSHIEIDIRRQVLLVTEDHGTIVYILPVSTGNEKPYVDKGERQIAHTPRGRFRIERKINGTRISTLGPMYYPSYFYQGVAIHGSGSVPPYPASHGCVRIPRFAEKKFFGMAGIGMEVFVYD